MKKALRVLLCAFLLLVPASSVMAQCGWDCYNSIDITYCQATYGGWGTMWSCDDWWECYYYSWGWYCIQECRGNYCW